jgi:hypothetical protein
LISITGSPFLTYFEYLNPPASSFLDEPNPKGQAKKFVLTKVIFIYQQYGKLNYYHLLSQDIQVEISKSFEF